MQLKHKRKKPINETFETGWTADDNVITAENEEGTPAANLKLQGWGDGFTFTVVNDAGNGANSSDYFAKMNRGERFQSRSNSTPC